ncbi:unnamed protein product [Blepharisma stoltei]|uniref:Uncharacterized protein n=1 Tax=Blepharisma stoltei TaxID=1481888 RepID=A0AAU9J8U8_9CILI|nr:unnamed protein product [Blepharisma stoltei]
MAKCFFEKAKIKKNNNKIEKIEDDHIICADKVETQVSDIWKLAELAKKEKLFCSLTGSGFLGKNRDFLNGFVCSRRELVQFILLLK